MTAEQLAAIMSDAMGNPSSGTIADAIPALAKAVAAHLTPGEAEDAQPEQ